MQWKPRSWTLALTAMVTVAHLRGADEQIEGDQGERHPGKLAAIVGFVAENEHRRRLRAGTGFGATIACERVKRRQQTGGRG